MEENNSPEIHESNEAKRQRLLGVENNITIHDDEATIKKGKFWANLWFNHKWKIIIIAFFLVVLLITVPQCMQKTRNDITVSYFGPVYITGTLHSEIQNAIQAVMEDYNGDGQKLLNFATVTYQGKNGISNTKENENIFGAVLSVQANKEAYKGINYQINSGDVCFYIMSKEVFDSFKGYFLTVKDILGEDYQIDESMVYNGKGLEISKTNFAKVHTALSKILDENTVICIEKIHNTDVHELEYAKKLFKAILEME